ncbi:MAG: 3-methylitaconate isomerase, partial [Actinobacteria bacterium]|nr:3-methylitaconate isomerase [Actinomycetota bacterium]
MKNTFETLPLPCTIMRGGTSRAIFFRAENLPAARPSIEKILLNVLGSPDVRQINGLGGATPQTSKVAIISKSEFEDADVDYLFAQVDITSELIDWGGNCGNISSAVGPFAINEGLVEANLDGSITPVRIHNVNTGKIIVAQVPVIGSRAAVEGTTFIAGVPTPGARIDLDFLKPTGAVSGKVLPTGHLQDEMTLSDGRHIFVSVVDAANPTVFVRAQDINMVGTELPAEIESRPDILRVIEEIRGQAAVWLGLTASADRASAETPGLPKIGFISPATDYTMSSGGKISKNDIDLTVRMFSIRSPHKACQITAGIAT